MELFLSRNNEALAIGGFFPFRRNGSSILVTHSTSNIPVPSALATHRKDKSLVSNSGGFHLHESGYLVRILSERGSLSE